MEETINWDAVKIIVLVVAIVYIYKLSRKSKTLGKLGMNTNNLLLIGSLKNIVNYMPDEKQKIYTDLFHSIIMAQDKTEEILALEEATKKLDNYYEED